MATAIFTADDPTKSFVWVIDEGASTLARREVQPGALSEFGMRIRGGLKAGEWIVVAGVNALDEGQAVVRLGDEGAGS